MTAAKNRSGKKILIAAAIVFLFAALFFITAKMIGWFNNKETPRLEVVQPGSSDDSAYPDMVYKESSVTEKLSAKLKESLEEEYGLQSWYQISVRGQSETSAVSDEFKAADQLWYGMWLLEQKQEKLFMSWKEDFESDYLRQGLIIESVSRNNPESISSDSGSWKESLLFARILITAYDLWPSNEMWRQIEDLSDMLIGFFTPAGSLPLNYTAAIPTPAAAPDPAATPTPKPELSPTPEPMPVFQLTELSSIDLLAIRLLIQIDPEWSEIYDKVLVLVKGAYISDQLPLYARAVWPDRQGYLLFPGDQPNIDAEASLTVLLHLCEVGEADERSIRWLSEQLFNNSAVYKSYHAAQGHASSEEESIAGYAAAARIARITGDRPMYEKAVSRLAWHIATNPRSEARDLIFRQSSDEQIRVYAQDNIWALLAMD